MADELPIGFSGINAPIADRDDQQPTVGQPAEPGWPAGNLEAFAQRPVRIDRDDLAVMTIREPQGAVAPSWAFGEDEAVVEQFQSGHAESSRGAYGAAPWPNVNCR